MPGPTRIPSYRLHKPSGRAVVTLNGKDHYLGAYGSPESSREYQRVVAEWLTRQQAPPPQPATPAVVTDLSLAELMLAYLRFAAGYYRATDGRPTGEADNAIRALRPLEAMYGCTSAAAFGPLALKAVRQAMIDAQLCRRVVNQRVGIIRRMFKWAAAEELVPAGAYHGLAAVDGLRRGRSAARETEPVGPATDHDVNAVLPYLPPTVRAMVQLQWLTGMRSGELVRLRGADLEVSGETWLYRPARHKTSHHGLRRAVAIGPAAQRALRELLPADPLAYVFSPARAQRERNDAKRLARQTKVQPSQACRKKFAPARAPGQRYSTRSYYYAIRYAIRKAREAGVPVADWHPHQLRHSAATRIRRERGLDAARAVLGHRSLAVADTYAEIDSALAVAVAAELG